jgi:hypothetical protein
LLPLVALGGEVLAERRAILGVVPLALLAVGIPNNVDLLRTPVHTIGVRDLVTAASHSPLLPQLRAQDRLFNVPGVPSMAPTAGFLRAAAKDGQLPDLGRPSAQAALTADGWVALHQTGRTSGPSCPATSPRSIRVARGARVVFSGTVVVALRRGTETSGLFPFNSRNGNTIAVRAGPIDLLVSGPLGRPAICRVVR